MHGGFGFVRITPYIACDPANHEGQWETKKEAILALKTYISYGMNSHFHRLSLASLILLHCIMTAEL